MICNEWITHANIDKSVAILDTQLSRCFYCMPMCACVLYLWEGGILMVHSWQPEWISRLYIWMHDHELLKIPRGRWPTHDQYHMAHWWSLSMNQPSMRLRMTIPWSIHNIVHGSMYDQHFIIHVHDPCLHHTIPLYMLNTHLKNYYFD